MTRIGSRLLGHLASDPEHFEDDQAVLFLTGRRISATVIDGYDNDTEAVADVFAHLSAVFEANGKKLLIVPIGRG